MTFTAALALAAGGCGVLVGESVRAAHKADEAASEAAVSADAAAAFRAARGAVADLGFEERSQTFDRKKLTGKVVARTAQDVTITTVVKGESATLSRVSVKAGTFGNDPLQAQVLRAILDRLADPTRADRRAGGRWRGRGGAGTMTPLPRA